MRPHSLLAAASLAAMACFVASASQGAEMTPPDAAATPDAIIFAVRQPGTDPHYYANFGYFAFDPERKAYGHGGKLCRLHLQTGRFDVLLNDPDGAVRDPQVHYDGQKVLFSYRKGDAPNYNLYEIEVDGSNLRQITDGPWDDNEPTYLPDGGIAFCSSRCRRWVNCWPTQVAVLYRCDPEGRNVQMLSSNNQHDNTPWVLPDGRILYTRWEYVDRSEVAYHHLWTAHPDGTSQTVFFGNMHPGIAMLDAKPIPGTHQVVASFSPGHGLREHAGHVTIVDPSTGPDATAFAQRISSTADYRDPYPVASNRFLVARQASLLLMDRKGATTPLFTLPKEDRDRGLECHEPRPLQARSREALIPHGVDFAQQKGLLLLADIYRGRNMAAVKRGEIKELLILETLPKPINFTGSGDPLSYNGTFTLERILGTVPVEPDGSACFEVPALRSLFFVALDKDGLAVKRMQSFLTVQPGETLSCVGCHENRTEAPSGMSSLLASRRPPSPVQPVPGTPEVFDFPRHIQPILNRHCLPCHDVEQRKGDVLLTADRGPFFSHSFWTLTVRAQFSDGRNLPRSNYRPRTLGSAASPLLTKLDRGHHEVKVTDQERTMVRLWIDSGAPFAGTYAALGTGMIGAYREDKLDRSDTNWPAVKAAAAALQRRCGSCHHGPLALPSSPSDDLGMPPWESKLNDPRTRFSRHILYNLTRPELSLLLLAPLSKSAGGKGICSNTKKPVLDSTSDPDYQVILASIVESRRVLDQMKRFDMPGFRPGPEYVRELKRYGILPSGFSPDQPIDVYAADKAYWESHWPKPPAAR